jgi:ATP adenylyltransferase
MKQLWAPWRMEYINQEKTETSKSCIFCSRIAQRRDKKNLIVFRGDLAFIIMNRFPYNNGHLMVVPYRHTGDLPQLKKDEKADLFQLLQLSVKVLETVMKPQGYNIGMNLGRVAGAGVEDHLHFHIVPRWNGDTNFMPVLAGTKVISEALERSYQKLQAAFGQMGHRKK